MPRGSAWLALAGLVLGGAVTTAPAACACECLPITPDQAAAEADAVFVGTALRLVSIKDPDSPEPLTYEFSVDSVVKGTLVAGPRFRIQTNNGSDACGVSFEIGRRYVVYAVDSDGIAFVTECGGTHRLAAGARGPRPGGFSLRLGARSGVPPRPVDALSPAA